MLAQHERGERHRGGLGDERAEHWNERQHDEEERHRFAVRFDRHDARQRPHGQARKLNNRFARRNNHHDKHEHRFREIAPFKVINRRCFSGEGELKRDKHERPKPEHHFHFA